MLTGRTVSGMFPTWVNLKDGRLECAFAKVEAHAMVYVPRQGLDARLPSSRSSGLIFSG